MDEEFEVLPCTPDSIKSLLSAKSEIPLSRIEHKLHVRYFEDYFKDIGAATIVVENNYVDHDYVEDHAEYYVRCFKNYKRKCTRLHIFKIELSKDDIDEFLAGNNHELTESILQDNYLGFIVIKPLPKTVIGRTCLETYPSDASRFFPITRTYSANLFGIPLVVKNSLAFQEQDTVVAACATSALWSIFQGTGKLFQHAIPSPSAITKAATEHITDSERTRAFPSKGLDPIEMARAIKHVELEPHLVKVTNEYVLKSTAYAYLKLGIPMILGFPLYDTSYNPCSHMGKHAVAVAGYNLPDGDPIGFGKSNFRLKANRIDKIYAHDDQVGPFARMAFDKRNIPVQDGLGNIVNIASLSTSWRGMDGVIGSGRAVPEVLLIPLYHKIRIQFACIHDQIMELDSLISKVFLDTQAEFPETDKYEWDIYLATVNKFKSELLRDTGVDKERCNYLKSGMPKYIWRATVNYDQKKVMDVLFDATDMEQSSLIFNVIAYNSTFATNLRNTMVADRVVIENAYAKSIALPIIEWIRDHF